MDSPDQRVFAPAEVVALRDLRRAWRWFYDVHPRLLRPQVEFESQQRFAAFNSKGELLAGGMDKVIPVRVSKSKHSPPSPLACQEA